MADQTSPDMIGFLTRSTMSLYLRTQITISQWQRLSNMFQKSCEITKQSSVSDSSMLLSCAWQALSVSVARYLYIFYAIGSLLMGPGSSPSFPIKARHWSTHSLLIKQYVRPLSTTLILSSSFSYLYSVISSLIRFFDPSSASSGNWNGSGSRKKYFLNFMLQYFLIICSFLRSSSYVYTKKDIKFTPQDYITYHLCGDLFLHSALMVCPAINISFFCRSRFTGLFHTI